MSQLKSAFVDKLKRALNSSSFTTDDFLLELPESGRVLLSIKFVYSPSSHWLVLTEDTKYRRGTALAGIAQIPDETRTIELTLSMQPGNVKQRDSYEIDRIEDVLQTIPRWIEHIREDLYSRAPKTDPLEEIRKKLQEEIEAAVTDPAGVFTPEEQVLLDARMDKLLEEMQTLLKDHKATRQELDDLKRQFDEFKKSARTYPKGMWAKITGNKLVKGLASMVNSPEGRALITQQITKALGNGGP